jgi:hypothetical protein
MIVQDRLTASWFRDPNIKTIHSDTFSWQHKAVFIEAISSRIGALDDHKGASASGHFQAVINWKV